MVVSLVTSLETASMRATTTAWEDGGPAASPDYRTRGAGDRPGDREDGKPEQQQQRQGEQGCARGPGHYGVSRIRAP